MADPVTDPKLLAILNGGQNPPAADGLVTDPALLATLNGTPVDNTPAPTETVEYDPMGNPIGGVYTNTLPSAQQGKDLKGSTAAFSDEALNRVPIIGPAIKAGTDRAVALGKSVGNGTSYSDELKNVQNKIETAKAEHPVATTAGHAAGTMLGLAPLMAVAPAAMGIDAGATMLTNMGAGAASNALVSATDAAVRGEPITEAGVTGAITGGATPILGKLIGNAINFIKPEAKTVLSGFDPKAVKWAADAAKADGLTDAQIAKMINEKGPQAFLGEYGPNMKGLATGAASMPGGEGKQALIQGVEQRVAPEIVRTRIETGINEALGKPQNLTQLTLEGIDQRAKDANPLYQAFKGTQVPPTPEVKAMTEQLQELGLFQKAEHLAKLESAATGQPVAPMRNFFTTGEKKDWPTTQSWNYVKQAIDEKIGRSYNDLGQPTQYTRFYMQLKNRLDDVISKSSKDAGRVWNEARDTWASQSSVMNARTAGTKAWDKSYTKDQLLEDLTNMSAPERAAYKEGARTGLAEKMNNSVNGDTQVRDLLRSNNAKDKMRALATNKSYDPEKLLNQMEHEKGYLDTKKTFGTTTEKEAAKVQHEKITPNPEDLLINKMSEKYAPHIRPLDWVPGVSAFKRGFATRQTSAFENARDDLAKMLAAQGPQAQEYARALLATKPPSNAGLGAASIVRALAQPVTPNVPLPFGLSQRPNQ